MVHAYKSPHRSGAGTKQEDYMFKACLSYIVRFCQKKKKVESERKRIGSFPRVFGSSILNLFHMKKLDWNMFVLNIWEAEEGGSEV